MNRCGRLLQWRNGFGGKAGRQFWQVFAASPAFKQGAFGLAIRVAEFDAHQKAVKLRFWQREGADLG